MNPEIKEESPADKVSPGTKTNDGVEAVSGTQGRPEGEDPSPAEDSPLEAAPELPEPGEIDVRGLLFRTLIGFVGLVVLLVIAGAYLRAPLMKVSAIFVKAVGGVGIAAGWFLIDGVGFPFPNDVLSFFGIQGGMSFWSVIFWSTLGSLLGGSVGFFIGGALRKTDWFVRLVAGRGSEPYNLVRRYGYIAVGIGAMTPVPYSISAWACGMVKLRFDYFLLISLLRIPRIILYLYFIKLGFKPF